VREGAYKVVAHAEPPRMHESGEGAPLSLSLSLSRSLGRT
jgi:hypothetical protein